MKTNQLILRCAVFAMIGGVSFVSAGAEGPGAEFRVRALSDKHTLSEWGREVVLPEMSSSADVRSRFADEGELPDFGEFLSEEINSFGAGATDSEQLRKMMANRAIGREDDSVMSWMSSRWKNAPNRLAGFLTDYTESRLGEMPGVESADIDWAPDDEGFGAFSASGVGVLRPSDDQAFGFQPRIERQQADGRLLGSFGVFHRRALGDSAVAGLNIFTEHMDDPHRGSFSRWWLGADFASRWVDADVKRYIGGDGREIWRDNRRFRAYTPDGLSAELRVHSPDLRWLEGYAKFSEWSGRGENADTRTKSFGLTFQPFIGPLAGLRTDAEFAGDDVNVALEYAWTFGQGAATPQNADPFAVYTDIAKSVENPEDFNIHEFELYEVAHLYESADRLRDPEIDHQEIFRRVSLSWELVPEYLRIPEALRPYCPPPRYISLSGQSRTFRDASARGLWSTAGLCNYLNADHTSPYSWWVGNGFAGSLLYVMAVEHLNVDAVKLLMITGINAAWGGIFSDNPDFPRTRPTTWNGSHSHAKGHRPSVMRQNTIEGLAMRHKLIQDTSGDQQLLERVSVIAAMLHANWDLYADVNHIVLGYGEGSPVRHVSERCRDDRFNAQQYDGKYSDRNHEHIVAICDMGSRGLVGLRMHYHHPADTVTVSPPEGGLLPTASESANSDIVAYVARGYSGEVFRITATTDYADVEYTMSQAGRKFSLTVDGEYIMYYDPYGRGHRETKQDISGDTRIAIIHMTDQSAPAANYVLTVKADFFYHVRNHNNVTMAYTVAVLPHSTQTVRWGDASSGAVGTLSMDEVDDAVFAWIGGSSMLTVHENGEIHIAPNGRLTSPATVTLLAGAVSSGGKMRGTLKFTVEAEIYASSPVTVSAISVFAEDADWTAPMVFATDEFTGAAFTMSVATPVDSASFFVAADGAFRVRGEGASGIVEIASKLSAALHVGTVFAELRKAGHHSTTLFAVFTVSALAGRDDQTGIAADGHTGELDFEYPPVPGLTFAETESHSRLKLAFGNRIRLLEELLPTESAAIRMSGTSPHLRGELNIAYAALNPDLDDKRGLPPNCVLPADGRAVNDPNSRLRRAVNSDAVGDACAAIRDGADVNLKHWRGARPLDYAIRRVNLQMQRVLLANGAEIDYETPKQGGPMRQAARFADVQFGLFMARRDLESVNRQYENRGAPVHALADQSARFSRGDVGAFVRKVLAAHGADLNALNGDGRTYLHAAAFTGNIAALRSVLEAGAGTIDPNIKSSDGELPLALFVDKKNHDAVETLLDVSLASAVDINAKDGDGNAAIHYVRDAEMYGLIWDLALNINAENGDGETLSDILAQLDRDGEAVDMFLVDDLFLDG